MVCLVQRIVDEGDVSTDQQTIASYEFHLGTMYNTADRISSTHKAA